MAAADRVLGRWPIAAVTLLLLAAGTYLGFALWRDWEPARDPVQLGIFGDYLGGVLGASFGFLSLLLLTKSLTEARTASQLATAQAMIAGIEAMDRDLQSLLGLRLPHKVWIGEVAYAQFTFWGPMRDAQGLVSTRSDSLGEMLTTVASWHDKAKPLSPILTQRRELAVSLCRFADTLAAFDDASAHRLRRFSDYYRARYRAVVDLLNSQCDGFGTCAKSLHSHHAGDCEKAFNAAL